jgi:hypothetical protein
MQRGRHFIRPHPSAEFTRLAVSGALACDWLNRGLHDQKATNSGDLRDFVGAALAVCALHTWRCMEATP